MAFNSLPSSSDDPMSSSPHSAKGKEPASSKMGESSSGTGSGSGSSHVDSMGDPNEDVAKIAALEQDILLAQRAEARRRATARLVEQQRQLAVHEEEQQIQIQKEHELDMMQKKLRGLPKVKKAKKVSRWASHLGAALNVVVLKQRVPGGRVMKKETPLLRVVLG